MRKNLEGNKRKMTHNKGSLIRLIADFFFFIRNYAGQKAVKWHIYTADGKKKKKKLLTMNSTCRNNEIKAENKTYWEKIILGEFDAMRIVL